MNDSTVLLAPEVEALLVEMARDPASRLLRVPRAAALPDLVPERRALTVGPATRAERHLAAAYREEVALALTRLAARMALRSKSLAGLLVVVREPDAEELATVALRLLVAGEAGDVEREGLGRAARRDEIPADDAEPARFLAAALRLAEPRGARAWWPLLLLAAGDTHGAWRAAIDAERAVREPSTRAIAGSNAGLAAWRLGRFADAADAYGRAHRAREDEPLYLAFHHLNAYLAHRVGETVELVDERYPEGAPLRAFLERSLAVAPVPGLARLAARPREVPRKFARVAEVFHGVA